MNCKVSELIKLYLQTPRHTPMCTFKHKHKITPKPGNLPQNKASFTLRGNKNLCLPQIMFLKNNMEVYKQTLRY